MCSGGRSHFSATTTKKHECFRWTVSMLPVVCSVSSQKPPQRYSTASLAKPELCHSTQQLSLFHGPSRLCGELRLQRAFCISLAAALLHSLTLNATESFKFLWRETKNSIDDQSRKTRGSRPNVHPYCGVDTRMVF
jgi:hypothetical protein